ncbi:MAG: glycoside hydrolase 43 family protein [Lachnospiraceae bacterium]|jgi:beta-xylosidase|nr:glycoside hydrolase 43 family protein [Lachnospiraceae bacterium]
MTKSVRESNPIIRMDYPDLDVIRVGEYFYMISTSMYFMPGGEILRSKDLQTWEHASFVFDTLDHTPKQTLEGEEHAYGQGMWAASLRYHNERYYVCFVANDTGKTYLYTASDIEGPWEKSTIEGFFHDASLLFDEGRVFIVYGNRSIYLTELDRELHAPLPGGLHRMLLCDENNPSLGYEGSHLYRIRNKYYLLLIHSLPDRWRRVQACFVSDSLEGEFLGGDVFDEDFGHMNQGIAQGGIVDTPDGDWYSILFQDRGAVGRLPVLIPIRWEGDRLLYDVNGKLPTIQREENEDAPIMPLASSDDFKRLDQALPLDRKKHGCFGFRSFWQFNHEPDLSLIHHDETAGIFSILTGKLCQNVTQARNTLTQRMMEPSCAGEVWVDGSLLRVGDYAGLCALQGSYGLVAVTKKEDATYLVMRSKVLMNDQVTEQEWERIPLDHPEVHLKLEVTFQNQSNDQKDEATFYYEKAGEWKQIGIKHALFFRLDHFTGCRFGLFTYATQEIGGQGSFREFTYRVPQ